MTTREEQIAQYPPAQMIVRFERYEIRALIDKLVGLLADASEEKPVLRVSVDAGDPSQKTKYDGLFAPKVSFSTHQSAFATSGVITHRSPMEEL